MRLLIADDDPLVTDQLQHFAEKLGATEVVVVHSGSEALTALRKGGFDLLVSDVHMPGLTGPELLATLGNTVPVIIVASAPAAHPIRGAAKVRKKPARTNTKKGALRCAPSLREDNEGFMGAGG